MNVPDELYADFESDNQTAKSKQPKNTVPGYTPRSVNSLYREEDIDDANLVFVTMTEQAADLLREIGLTSTAPPRSPGSIKTANWKPLTGRPVAIVVEASPAGKKFTTEVIHQLKKQDPTAEIRILDLLTPPMGEDVVSKWIHDHQVHSKGNLGEQLLNQVTKIAPFDDGGDDFDDQSPRNRQSLVENTEADGKPKDLSQKELLFAMCETVPIFHTPEKRGYATIAIRIPGDEHEVRFEHHPIRSRTFKDWLTLQYYNIRNQAPSGEALETTINSLDARARLAAPEEKVYIRVAELCDTEGPKIYLDLANSLGQVAKITHKGWEILSNPPVKFRRSDTMRALPVPDRGGSIDALRPFVNVRSESDSDWRLLVVVLCAYLRARGPYPILVIQGEQGSAKSTTTRIISQLTDPSGVQRNMSKDLHSLAISANNCHVLSFDNLSGISPAQSDALCRLATGSGFATRKMYADDEETVFQATKPIVLNGIDDLTERPDLASRSVVFYLPRIDPEGRRTEAEFWAEFEAATPKILGALLDALSGGLARYPEVQLEGLLRMADFTRLGEAIGQSLGWPEGAFLEAYEQNQKSASVTSIEASPVAMAVRKLTADQPEWEGTATELLEILEDRYVNDSIRRCHDWPRQANKLSGKLKRVAPALREEGVQIEIGTSGKDRSIRITSATPARRVEPSSGSSEPLPELDEDDPIGF